MATFAIMLLSVQINRSQTPVCCGLPGTLKRGVQPNIDKNVLVNSLQKLDAQSDSIHPGTPVV